MERKFDVPSLLERLRNGEKINCVECGKGIYVTTNGYLKTSHAFWCNLCGSVIHTTPADVVVE